MRSIVHLSLAGLLILGSVQSAHSQADLATPPSPPPLIDSEPVPAPDPIELPTSSPVPSDDPVPSAPVVAPEPVVVVDQEVSGAETTTFQDWALECFSDVACQITHRVLASGGGQIVVVVALISEADEGPARLQLAVPLGISSHAGIRLTIGNQYQANVPIARCTPQGCLVEGTASDALLAAMRRGQRGQLSVINETGTAIDLPFSLMGFTAAYAEMIERNRRN